jgi:hypothetical protein
MVKPIVDFIISHDLSMSMFPYLFVLKYERQPTPSESKDSHILYDEILDEESYEESYEESLSYDEDDED